LCFDAGQSQAERRENDSCGPGNVHMGFLKEVCPVNSY
jgi:hypothetical protein